MITQLAPGAALGWAGVAAVTGMALGWGRHHRGGDACLRPARQQGRCQQRATPRSQPDRTARTDSIVAASALRTGTAVRPRPASSACQGHRGAVSAIQVTSRDGRLDAPHVRRSRAAALFWSRAISAGLPGSGSRPGRRCRSAAPLRRRPEQRPQRPPRGGQPRSSPASGPGVRVRQGAGRRASALAVPRPVTRHREHESRLCTSSGACQGAGPVRVGVPSTTGLLRACSLACGPCVCENYRDESQ